MRPQWLKNLLFGNDSGSRALSLRTVSHAREPSLEEELAVTDPNDPMRGKPLLAMLRFMEKALGDLAQNNYDAEREMKEICSFENDAMCVTLSGRYRKARNMAQMYALFSEKNSYNLNDYASIETQVRMQVRDGMPAYYPDFRLLDRVASAAGIKVLRTDEDAFYQKGNNELHKPGLAHIYPGAIEFSPEGKRIGVGNGRYTIEELGLEHKKDFGMENEMVFHSQDIPRLQQTVRRLIDILERGTAKLPEAGGPKRLR